MNLIVFEGEFIIVELSDVSFVLEFFFDIENLFLFFLEEFFCLYEVFFCLKLLFKCEELALGFG